MDFFSLDVETANADLSSICQVGLVQFKDGLVVNRWSSLVNPEDYFSSFNVRIHGITEEQVVDAPKFPEICEHLQKNLSGTVVTSHTAFDRAAIHAVHAKHKLSPPEIVWLDTAKVVRRTWTEYARCGYGLDPIAQMLGIEFNHHDALEDARACGEILIHAIRKTGLSIDDWLVRVRKPISGGDNYSSRIVREGNPDGPLIGEVAVFTGALSIPRREAADLAAQAGCEVAANVTAKTTLLIVGDQDILRLAGHETSSKQRKAEQLIEKGQTIRILRETDFLSLVSIAES